MNKFETIFNELRDTYTVDAADLHDCEKPPKGKPPIVTGQAVSFLVRNVSRRVLPAGLYDAERELESLGFRILDGRNSRGQKTRVVTL